MEECSKNDSRIKWIDMLKGITILLVAFNHAVCAAYSDAISTHSSSILFDWFVHSSNSLLAVARMPAFFLAAGIVMAALKKNKLKWFLSKRMPLMIWLIIIWTLLSFLVERIGLHLYPWEPYPYLPQNSLFILPYGNLWFIYALLILSGIAAVVSYMSYLKQMIITIILALLILFSMQYGFLKNILFHNLCFIGLPFFMAGFIFKKQVTYIFKRSNRLMLWMVGLAVFVLLIHSLLFITYGSIRTSGFIRILILNIPVTFFFVGLVVYLMSYSDYINTTFINIGKNSLEIFLLHQFFVALFIHLYKLIGFDVNSVLGKIVLILFPIILCVVFVHYFKGILKPILFTVPKFGNNKVLVRLPRL
nr:acyltransferase [uncultured Carboxylicivirga sp.]